MKSSAKKRKTYAEIREYTNQKKMIKKNSRKNKKVREQKRSLDFLDEE